MEYYWDRFISNYSVVFPKRNLEKDLALSGLIFILEQYHGYITEQCGFSCRDESVKEE